MWKFTREGRGPVVLVVDGLIVGDDEHGTLLSDVVTRNSTFNDMAEVEMRVIARIPVCRGSKRRPDPSQRCHDHAVSRRVRRTDGRSTQGVDVPYSFDSALTFTVPSDGASSAVFQLVRHAAKEEAP